MAPRMMGGPGGPRGMGGPGGPGEGKRKGSRENPNAPAISAENATFSMKNGFLYMQCPKDAEPVRVNLHRNFPFTFLWEYISVLDMSNYELATIRDVALFDEEMKALLVRELERKYYSPAISRILSVKDRFGFSYWDVETSGGRLTFTLQDTFKSIVRAGENKLFFFDVDGNRFVIEDVDTLDRKSRKRIEIYL
ncbi:MAG: DUF1854 domain-containing protein [Clostridia bacterium]|nr:DUF1854 domain-containing protein [Clostridia bacterium]